MMGRAGGSSDGGGEGGDPRAAAAYVAALAGDLSQIARRNGLDMLSYLLDMARLEAEMQAGPPAARRAP